MDHHKTVNPCCNVLPRSYVVHYSKEISFLHFGFRLDFVEYVKTATELSRLV